MSRQVTTDAEALQAFSEITQTMPLKETKHFLGIGISLASYYGFRRGEGHTVQSAFNYAVIQLANVLAKSIQNPNPTQYRRLEKGEIILPTDEIYDDDKKAWRPPTYSVGGLAPDPNYTAHRQFRRKIGDAPRPVGEGSANNIAIFAGLCIGLREDKAVNLLNHEKINWRVRRRDGHVVFRRKVSDVPVPTRANLTISEGIVIRVEMW